MGFSVHPVEALMDNYMYLVVDDNTKRAFAVDPVDAEVRGHDRLPEPTCILEVLKRF